MLCNHSCQKALILKRFQFHLPVKLIKRMKLGHVQFTDKKQALSSEWIINFQESTTF